MDNILFAGQKNLAAFGPEYLDRFGFNLSGKHEFEAGVLRWEVLGSRISSFQDFAPYQVWDANLNQLVDVNIGHYDTDIIGVDVGFEFGGGQVKLNFMRAANEAANGENLTIGNIYGVNATTPNGVYGSAYGDYNMSSLNWINPEQYEAFPPFHGNNTAANQPIGEFGALGPQSMLGYGISANYKWDIGENGNEIYVAGEYAHTEYKSNKNSDYSSDGSAYRIEVGANLLEGDLDLSLAYVGVDPNYDPFVNENPTINGFANRFIGNGAGARYTAYNLMNMNDYANMWSLHDTEVYPHNREGLRFNGQWRFSDRHGIVWAKFAFLNQKKSSLYDVRYIDGMGDAHLGFAPGFMDPVFYGYSDLSYDVNLDAMEDHKGKQTQFGIGANYKWDNPRLKLDLGYEHNDFKRNSDLPAIDGGSQNHVKLNTENIHIGLGWEANDMWTLRVGCDMVNFNGHWDPTGSYNQFAQLVNSTDFKNIDVQQTVPFIGFDCDLSANTQWNMDFRYYDTKDKVDASTFADYTGNGQTNIDHWDGYTAHPFSWYGWQVTTQFKVKF